MKLIEKYIGLKKEYINTVILLKSGTFYVTYNDDAFIVGYLMNYQIKDDNKIGFPKNSLDKIMKVLLENKINVYIVDDDIKKDYNDNRYEKVLFTAKRNHFNDLNIKLLIEEITFLLKENPENMTKIRSFISEL